MSVRPRVIACTAFLAAAAGCTRPDCCIDNYPPAYAVVYGVARFASQAAPNILIQAGDSSVRTGAAGEYRLLTSRRGYAQGLGPLSVRASRTTATGALDSVRVDLVVPFYSSQSVRDSARVDIVFAATP